MLFLMRASPIFSSDILRVNAALAQMKDLLQTWPKKNERQGQER
jgi:hypothetical protein